MNNIDISLEYTKELPDYEVSNVFEEKVNEVFKNINVLNLINSLIRATAAAINNGNDTNDIAPIEGIEFSDGLTLVNIRGRSSSCSEITMLSNILDNMD